MTVEGTPPNPDTHKDTRDMKSLPGATGGKPSPSSSPVRHKIKNTAKFGCAFYFMAHDFQLDFFCLLHRVLR